MSRRTRIFVYIPTRRFVLFAAVSSQDSSCCCRGWRVFLHTSGPIFRVFCTEICFRLFSLFPGLSVTVQILHSVYYVNIVSKLLINCSNGYQSLVAFTTGRYPNVTFGDPDETFQILRDRLSFCLTEIDQWIVKGLVLVYLMRSKLATHC